MATSIVAAAPGPASGHAGFGDELQVGIVANAWESDPRPWVEVERIHFGTPESTADCTTAVDPV
jgi:hypothetical protein